MDCDSNKTPDDFPAKHRKKRGKSPKPYTIEWRCLRGFTMFKDWITWGRYATPSIRDQALADLQNKAPKSFDYRAGIDPN
jgi:hypothetical protein